MTRCGRGKRWKDAKRQEEVDLQDQSGIGRNEIRESTTNNCTIVSLTKTKKTKGREREWEVKAGRDVRRVTQGPGDLGSAWDVL